MPEFDKLPSGIVMMLMAASAFTGMVASVIVGWFKLRTNRSAIVSAHELAFMDKIMSQIRLQDELIVQLRQEQVAQHDYYEKRATSDYKRYERLMAEQELKCHAEIAKLTAKINTKQEKFEKE